MGYLIFACAAASLALFCLLSVIFHISTFKSSKAFRNKQEKKAGTFAAIIDDISSIFAKKIPMGVLKRVELQKLLTSANIQITPEKYNAETFVYVIIWLLCAIPLYFVNKILVVIPVALGAYTLSKRKRELVEAKNKRVLEIEKELPRFVSFMNNIMKANRNIIDNLNSYRKDYDTPLTHELTITVADMRTGNFEKALQHLESRVNSTFMSSVTRGLIASLRGNDMTAYFDNLDVQLRNAWEQRLRAQALAKEPKITKMSLLLFAAAIITTVIILGATLFSIAGTIFTAGG